ncbi:hypothetical protein ABZ829_28105 [Streptomyces xanthochromogenes]|uniref:hypothetical protein n=1 Tax=Streptomyces xanthochromogenes TaxID=67384 RepID=UPI003438FF31
MGIGDDTAARRLRLLATEFTTPARRGSAEVAAARPAHSSAPLNLGIIDHMRAAVAEVVGQVRETAPDAGPRPEDDTAVYAWWRDGTAHLDDDAQQAREAIIYRQSLEHAIAMGDHDVIRPNLCPGCGCVGLMWDRLRRHVACVNRYCVDDVGLARTWTLAQVAHHHVGQKMLKKSAT